MARTSRRAAACSPRWSSISAAAPDLPDGVGDALGRRCRAPTRESARTWRGVAGSGRCCRTVRCRCCPPARRSGRRGCRRTGSSRARRRTRRIEDEQCGQRVDVVARELHVRVLRRDVRRPPRPRRASCGRCRWTWWPRRLGRTASARGRRRSERCARCRARVKTASCTAISSARPRKMRPPISEYSPSVFSRTITTSNPVRTAASGLSTPSSRRSRAQRHELVEAASDRDQQAPE